MYIDVDNMNKCIAVYEKELCCGCTACEFACPTKCITMITDNEGFRYPELNSQECIECGKCNNVCPIIKPTIYRKREAYAAKNRNDITRSKSSSGGVFTALANYILDQKGVVCGCRYDRNFEVIHSMSGQMEDVESFRGAKYVQSNKKDIYLKVKQVLQEGKKVLFSGTPCEIAGLKTYLNREYENLLCCDIVCHGVPSPKFFEQYLEYMENRYKDKIKSVYFRNKEKSWKRYHVMIEFEDNTYKEKYFNNEYMQGFLKDIALRPSCYHCKFKANNIYSDITLGDFWGIENIHPEFDDDKGISLILINTDKGNRVLKEIQTETAVIESDFQEATIKNPSLLKAVNKPLLRDEFYNLLETKGVGYVVDKIYSDYIERKGTNK